MLQKIPAGSMTRRRKRLRGTREASRLHWELVARSFKQPESDASREHTPHRQVLAMKSASAPPPSE